MINEMPVRFDTILDSIADGVFTVDHDWRITSFNRAAEEITGVPRGDAIGQHCREVLKADVCDRHCVLRYTKETGREVVNRTVNIIDARGRRLPVSQAGLGTRIVRIARKSPCSVLVVPELCQPHFNRVLVAVDRSEHAKLSLQTAVALAEAAGPSKMQLAAVAVRSVSPRYDLAGLTFHEAVEKQRGFGERDLREFLGQLDTRNVQVESIVVLSDDVGAAIAQVATARKMDLIILGSRGETRPTAVLLGSTSEQLLMTCALPVLVVKQKGETLRLLDALFEMS